MLNPHKRTCVIKSHQWVFVDGNFERKDYIYLLRGGPKKVLLFDPVQLKK
jgi:hypothetical protein